MVTEPHSADQAGGESVFTSDGLPSLAAPLPPPPLPSIGGAPSTRDGAPAPTDDDIDDGGGDAVVEEESNPREAFEAFSDAGGWGGLASYGVSSTWEDPRRRLFKLKAELDQLEASLANEQNTKEGREDDENLHAMTLELKSRLNALGMNDSSSLATMLRGRQEDLSRVIEKDLEKYAGQEGLAKGMEHLSLSKEESKEAGEGGGKIVYELYRESGAVKSSSTIPREAMLEERLRRLELAMGTTSTSSDAEKSIMERIHEAERLTKEVDAKQIEKLAAKAKVVRADLEAAARAKAKLASKSSSSHSAQQKEDSQTIAALHSQLGELDGISAHLPALTVRLLELSNLHTNAECCRVCF